MMTDTFFWGGRGSSPSEASRVQVIKCVGSELITHRTVVRSFWVLLRELLEDHPPFQTVEHSGPSR